MDLTAESVESGVFAVAFGIAALLSLLWPGPLAPTDRLPLALLLSIPAIVFADRLRHQRR